MVEWLMPNAQTLEAARGAAREYQKETWELHPWRMPANLEVSVNAARRDKHVRGWLLELAREITDRGDDLPNPLARLLLQMNDGALPTPTVDRCQRDALIIGGALLLWVDFGLKPTRNETSPRHSACDIVGEVWGLKYEMVRKIWYSARQ